MSSLLLMIPSIFGVVVDDVAVLGCVFDAFVAVPVLADLALFSR